MDASANDLIQHDTEICSHSSLACADIIQDQNDPQQLDRDDHHHLNGYEDQDQEDHSSGYEDQYQEVDEDDYHSCRCENQDQEVDEDDHDSSGCEDQDQEVDEDENYLDEDQLLDNHDGHNSDDDEDNLVEGDEIDVEEDNSHNSGKEACINDSYLNREPLYNGTDLTTIALVCLIMQFALSNNLTNKAIEDLLKLLNHLPTIYQKVITNFFDQFSVPYSYSEVCTSCNNCKEDCHCQPMVQATGHLLHVSFTKLLSAVLTNHWNSLKFLSSNSDHLYRDIWDGSFMKKVNDESSNNKKIISLLTSTDRIPPLLLAFGQLVLLLLTYHLLFV